MLPVRWAPLGIGGALSLLPEMQAFAQRAQDFIEGPPIPNIAPQQLSNVWMVYTGTVSHPEQGHDGQCAVCRPERGVVVLDTGASLQNWADGHPLDQKVTQQPGGGRFPIPTTTATTGWAAMLCRCLWQNRPSSRCKARRTRSKGHGGNLWRSLIDVGPTRLRGHPGGPNRITTRGRSVPGLAEVTPQRCTTTVRPARLPTCRVRVVETQLYRHWRHCAMETRIASHQTNGSCHRHASDTSMRWKRSRSRPALECPAA